VLVVAAAAAATAALAIGLGKVEFRGDLRSLDAQPPWTHELHQRFAKRYGTPPFPVMAIAHGETVERALERGDRVADVLAQARERGTIRAFSSPSWLLPSAARQSETFAGHARFLGDARIAEAAERAGFSADAFAPFFSDLADAGAAAAHLGAADFEGTPLEPLLERTLPRAGRLRVTALVYPSDSGGLPASLQDALRRLPGVEVVSQAGIAAQAVARIKESLLRLAGLGAALVAAVVLLVYRRIAPAAWALLPAALAILWGGGALGWAGVPLDVVSVGAFALASGLAVDYGVFTVDALRAARTGGGEARLGRAPIASVALAAGTTLCGFASLCVAHSPVMRSLGLAVCACVVAGLIVSLVIMPAAWLLWTTPGEAADRCTRCGDVLRRRDVRLASVALATVAGMGIALGGAWVAGAGQGGRQVVLALAADVVVVAWLGRRLLRVPRTCPRGCSGSGDLCR
jgi:predicted exporter